MHCKFALPNFSTFLFFLFTLVPKATKIIEKKQVFMDEY